SEVQYYVRSVGAGYWYPRAVVSNYPAAAAGSPGAAVTTTFAFTWYANSTQMNTRSTVVPKISASQNGAGDGGGDPQYTRNEFFDELGNLIAVQDERQYINTYQYDLPSGARTEMVEDDYPPPGTGWTRPSGAAAPLQLTTDYEIDLLGRTIQELGPAHTID